MDFRHLGAPCAGVSVATRYLRDSFFQSCWSSGFAINFTWFLQRRIFGSSNWPLGTPIEPKRTRDPAMSKNAKLAYLAVNLLPVFRFSHFFRKKQIAVVWSFRHLRHQSRGYLAAQRNRRQFYTINTFFVQSVELYANFLLFLNICVFLPKVCVQFYTLKTFCVASAELHSNFQSKAILFLTNFFAMVTFLIPAACGSWISSRIFPVGCVGVSKASRYCYCY